MLPGSDNPKKKRRKGCSVLFMRKTAESTGISEKEGMLYGPRGSESQSPWQFFPSIFTWAFCSFWVSSYCVLHGLKTVSVQSSFAPVKDCLGRLAAPTYLSPPTRQRCSEGVRSTHSWVAENLGVRAGHYYAEGSRDKQVILCPREWWQWELGSSAFGTQVRKGRGH